LYCAITIAKQKNIIALHRFVVSFILVAIPFVGIIIYQIVKNDLTKKEYKFFSEAYINKKLS
jgi:hypothetical protein